MKAYELLRHGFDLRLGDQIQRCQPHSHTASNVNRNEHNRHAGEILPVADPALQNYQ